MATNKTNKVEAYNANEILNSFNKSLEVLRSTERQTLEAFKSVVTNFVEAYKAKDKDLLIDFEGSIKKRFSESYTKKLLATLKKMGSIALNNPSVYNEIMDSEDIKSVTDFNATLRLYDAKGNLKEPKVTTPETEFQVVTALLASNDLKEKIKGLGVAIEFIPEDSPIIKELNGLSEEAFKLLSEAKEAVLESFREKLNKKTKGDE